MKKERTKGFISGVAASVLVFSLVGTAAATIGTKTLTADYSNIKIILEGVPVTPTDANGASVEPFAVEGTTYLPVRAIGNALGMNVEWIPERNVVELSSKKGNYQYDKCYYSYSVPDFEAVVGTDAYVKLDSPDNKYDVSFYYDPEKFEEDVKGSYLKEYGELLGKHGFSFSEHKGDDWIYFSWSSGMTVRVGSQKSTGYVIIEIKMPQGDRSGTTTIPPNTQSDNQKTGDTGSKNNGKGESGGDSGEVSSDAQYLADRAALDSAYQAERTKLVSAMESALSTYETAGYGMPEGDQKNIVVRNAEQVYNSAVKAVEDCDARYEADLAKLESKYGI